MTDTIQNEAEICGKVLHVGEVETFSAKFSKRTIVVEIGDKWPQEVPIEFVNDKAALLDKAAPGMTATIGVNIRGRRWDPPDDRPTRWFVSLNGWRIDLEGEADAPEPYDPGGFDKGDASGNGDDEIPF